MSEHGEKAITRGAPEEILRLAQAHMYEVHGSRTGRSRGFALLWNEFGAHVVYLADRQKKKLPLEFPKT